MRLDLRRALLCSLGLVFFLSLAPTTGPSPAAAQGKPAPGLNQAFLYEMSENAVLMNYLGNVLLPDPTGTSPTGLIDSATGVTTVPSVVPVRRVAVSELQGVAALGTPLCPSALLITIPKLKECTVTATGMDDVTLDLSTGQPVPTGGALSGTFEVVIQLDNNVDSPEWPLLTGAFYGSITFGAPGVPIGSATGFFVVGGQVSDAQACTAPSGTCLAFTAKFRQPFAKGHHMKPRRGEDAFYLLDNGKRQQVRQDERAVGWPTVRFEINF